MKIVLSTFGSLGDLHPMLALAIELKRRGHKIAVNSLENYREKIGTLGFEFFPLRPDLDPEKDRDLARRVMNRKSGSELLLREILLPNLEPMYEDLTEAIAGADVLISGEAVFPAKSAAEKTKISWISTTLAPGSFLSAEDPFVPPTAQWLEHLRFLGAPFHRMIYGFVRRFSAEWFEPYREFRRRLGLDENHNPIFGDKYSDLLNLAMFSKVLGKPQPDWHNPTLQTGFCFYDGQNDLGEMPKGLNEFIAAGEPPVVFTLGSAAVLDAGDFFEQSARAAKILGKRAVLLYGNFNRIPETKENGEWRVETGENIRSKIAAFDYAPYSQVFPRAAAVVHQGGIGTTAQVLRAGAPHLIMPYSHDQPDNAARCRRIGVAETISRDKYAAESAARKLKKILSDASYKTNAEEAGKTVESEQGTLTACNAIETILSDQ